MIRTGSIRRWAYMWACVLAMITFGLSATPAAAASSGSSVQVVEKPATVSLISQGSSGYVATLHLMFIPGADAATSSDASITVGDHVSTMNSGHSLRCDIGQNVTSLSPLVPTEVTFTFLPGCLPTLLQSSDRVEFHVLSFSQDHSAISRTSVTVIGPEPSVTTSWSDLGWITAGIGIAFVIVGAAVWLARRRHRQAQPIRWLFAPLQGLDSGWSFGSSWAANLTAIGTLVSGLFASSDVLKSILGTSPDQALAVMTVAGIVALGLAGAGTLITTTFTSESSPVTLAVVAAAIATLGGAIGQILVIGFEMEPFAITNWVWALVSASGLLLCLYGFFTIYRMITENDVDPVPAEPSDTLIGASAITLALEQAGSSQDAATVYSYAQALQKRVGVATFASRAFALRSQATNVLNVVAPTSAELIQKDHRLGTYFSDPAAGLLVDPIVGGEFTEESAKLEPYRSARRRRAAVL